jgi:hypothetical protein
LIMDQLLQRHTCCGYHFRAYAPTRRSILLECYKKLKSDEVMALPQRLSAATGELADVTERETELQQSFARLSQEVEDLRAGRVPTVLQPPMEA